MFKECLLPLLEFLPVYKSLSLKQSWMASDEPALGLYLFFFFFWLPPSSLMFLFCITSTVPWLIIGTFETITSNSRQWFFLQLPLITLTASCLSSRGHFSAVEVTSNPLNNQFQILSSNSMLLFQMVSFLMDILKHKFKLLDIFIFRKETQCCEHRVSL